MPNLDKFDIGILEALQEDARATNVEIAEKVNLSPSPCLRRIRNLEKSGVIRGYRLDIDRKEVGLGSDGVRGNQGRAAQPRKFRRATGGAACHAGNDSCFLISGTADFLAEVVVEDLSAYERFLTEKLSVASWRCGHPFEFCHPHRENGGSVKAPADVNRLSWRHHYSQNEMRLLKGSMTITSSPQSCCSIPGFMKR